MNGKVAKKLRRAAVRACDPKVSNQLELMQHTRNGRLVGTPVAGYPPNSYRSVYKLLKREARRNGS